METRRGIAEEGQVMKVPWGTMVKDATKLILYMKRIWFYEINEFEITEPNKKKFNNYCDLILSSLPTVLSELCSQ